MLTSTTAVPFSPCKQRQTVNDYTHFPILLTAVSFHRNAWGCDSLKEHREAVLTFRRCIQRVPCRLHHMLFFQRENIVKAQPLKKKAFSPFKVSYLLWGLHFFLPYVEDDLEKIFQINDQGLCLCAWTQTWDVFTVVHLILMQTQTCQINIRELTAMKADAASRVTLGTSRWQ